MTKKVIELAKPPSNNETQEAIHDFAKSALEVNVNSVLLIGLGPGQVFVTRMHIIGQEHPRMVAMLEIIKTEIVNELLDSLTD